MADNLINVVDPDTQEVGSIPEGQLSEAQSQGFSEASPKQAQDFIDEQKFGAPLEQAKTFGEHAANSSTFGGFAALQKAIDPEASQNALKRTHINPGTSFLGDVTGVVGSGLAGVGEGAVLNDASQAVKSALGLGQEGAGIGSRILGSAAEGAVQGGGFQAGDEAAKMFQDPDQTLGSALTNIGLYGMLGGAATGGALGAAGSLWDASVGTKLGQGIEDFKSRMSERVNTPDPVSALTDELGNLHTNISSVADEVYGASGLKAQDIAASMPKEITPKIQQQVQNVTDNLNQTLDKMMNSQDNYPPRLVNKFVGDIQQFENGVNSASNPGELFNAIQDLKQTMQGYSKFGKFVQPFEEHYDFVQQAKQLGHELRSGLEDSDVWGKAGDRQQAINKAFSEYLPALKDFQSKFMTKIAGEPQIDPGKIQTYINQTGKAGQSVRQNMLGNFLKATEKYKNVLDQTHSNLGIESPFPPSSTQFAEQTLQKLTPGAKLADAVYDKVLARVGGEALGAGVGGLAGHTVGMGGFGALIGEHMLGPAISSILPLLTKPLLESANNPGAFKAAIDYAMAAIKGDGLINRATKNIFKTGAEILPTSAIPNDKDLKKLDDTLKAFQENPDKLLDVGGKMPHYLPQHGQALGQMAANTVNGLNALRPAPSKQSPLDANPVIPAYEKAQYERALSIAEQPLMVLQHVKDGTLLPQDIKILSQMSPALHQKIVQKLTEEMTNHLSKGNPIPYKTRMGLSMLMGQPMDSTLSQPSILSNQATFQQNASPTQSAPNARGGHAHSMKALSNIAELDQTPLQERQRARSSNN